MKQLKDKVYYIKEGQYLVDIMDRILSNIILFKKLTGIGATALELYCERHSVICEPNVPVIKGKCAKNNTKAKTYVLGVYEGIRVEKIIAYLESNIKFKKIIVTPESFGKVKEAMSELKIDMYSTSMFVMDECERTIQDVGYRAKIILPMNDFFKFTNKAFISATPIMPSDPRFEEQHFRKVFVKPAKGYNHTQDIKVIETNNTLLTLRNFIETNERKQYFIFFNSTDSIAYFLNDLEAKDKSSIFCAKESMQKLKVNNFAHVSTQLGEFRCYNWLTSRFFSAVDIDDVVDPTIIIVTDLVAALHTKIDPLSEAVQIVGRFRKPEEGLIKKEVIHITNFLPELESQTAEEVKQYITDCKGVYRILQRYLKAATTRGAVDSFKEALTFIEFAKYLNADDTFNYFMQDNAIFEQRVNGYYQKVENLLAAYAQSDDFNAAHQKETYDVTDSQRALKQSSTPLKTVYSVIMPIIRDLYDPEITSPFSRDFQMGHLRREFKSVVQDFDRLGFDKVKEFDFDPRKIKAAIKEKFHLEQRTNFGLLQFIEENFKEGEVSASQSLVYRFNYGLRENKISKLKGNIKNLKKYMQLSDHIYVGKSVSGNDLQGYRVIKIYN